MDSRVTETPGTEKHLGTETKTGIINPRSERGSEWSELTSGKNVLSD